jgi:hypothetical protein
MDFLQVALWNKTDRHALARVCVLTLGISFEDKLESTLVMFKFIADFKLAHYSDWAPHLPSVENTIQRVLHGSGCSVSRSSWHYSWEKQMIGRISDTVVGIELSSTSVSNHSPTYQILQPDNVRTKLTVKILWLSTNCEAAHYLLLVRLLWDQKSDQVSHPHIC